MKPRTTVVLAAIAIGLFAFIALYEKDTLSTGETRARKGRLLERFVRDKVVSVEIEGKSAKVRLTKQVAKAQKKSKEETLDDFDDVAAGLDEWRMEKPVDAKADFDAVLGLLSAMEWAESRSTLADVSEEDLKNFGLNKPRVTAVFRIKNEDITMRCGKDTPNGEGVYLQLGESKTIHVVGKDFFEALDHDASHFRDKELLGVGVLSMSELTLKGKKLTKAEDGTWSLEGSRANPELESVVQLLSELSAQRFVQPRTDGMKEVASVMGATLLFGGTCDGYAEERYARVDRGQRVGPLTCILASDAERIEAMALAPFDLHALTVEDGEVSQIEVEWKGQRLSVSSDSDEKWSYRFSNGKSESVGSAPKEAIDDWLRALQAPVAIRRGLGTLQSGGGVLRIRGAKSVESSGEVKDGPLLGEIAFRMDGDALEIQNAKDKVILRFSDTFRSVLTPDPLRLSSREVLRVDEKAVRSLNVQRPGQKQETIAVNAGVFSVTSPINAPADPSALSDLMSRLSPLTALRFVGYQPISSQGLDTGIVLSVDHGGESVKLVVGNATDGGNFVRLGEGPVFVADAGLALVLGAPMVSKDLFAMKLDTLTAVTAKSDSGTLRFSRPGKGEDFQLDGVPLNQAHRDALLALSELRASTFTRYEKEEGLVSSLSLQFSSENGKQTLSFFAPSEEAANDALVLVPMRSSKYPLLRALVAKEAVDALSALTKE